MKRTRVTVKKEYDGEGRLVGEVTETVEEDTGGYPWNEYLPPEQGYPHTPGYLFERIRWGEPVDCTPVIT
jgi:hypothetical protein